MRSGRSIRRGFTLIELLVVCTIIGILAIIMLAQIQRALSQTRAAQTIANMKSLQSVIDMYKVEHGGEIPPPLTDGMYGSGGCAATATQNSGGLDLCAGWSPYIENIPPNTLNDPPYNNGHSFVWNSTYANSSGNWIDSAYEQYPTGDDSGFFFSRRYQLIFINNLGQYIDGRYYWELGQAWNSPGIKYDQAGFQGPWW